MLHPDPSLSLNATRLADERRACLSATLGWFADRLLLLLNTPKQTQVIPLCGVDTGCSARNLKLKSLFQSLRTLDWPRYSPKFAAFFAAYGLFAGTILGAGGDLTALLIQIAGGVVGAFVAGYTLPRNFSFWVNHNQGPVVAQITNGVFGALIGSIAVFFALGGWR